MRILFIGDIVGKPGREIVARLLPRLREELAPDFVIANGENLAHGLGITRETVKEVFGAGIDCLTTGNHVWNKKESHQLLAEDPRILRPANYPAEAPGSGHRLFRAGESWLGVINLIGRVFMEPLDSPFRAADQILSEMRSQTSCILVDFHAEATSEKQAMAWYLDGRVSAVLGTHTHVPTADERILPEGTGVITDVGMTGPEVSILGMRKELVIQRFVTQLPGPFDIASGPPMILSGAFMVLEDISGRCLEITRIQRRIGDDSHENLSDAKLV